MENKNLLSEVTRITELVHSSEILDAIDKMTEGFKPIARVCENHPILDTFPHISTQISAVLSNVNSLNFPAIVIPDVYTSLHQQFKDNLPTISGNISPYSGASISSFNPETHTFEVNEKTVYLLRNQVLNVHLIED
ncbi:MAG: hypothetical protein K0M56_00930 [Kaistella sp.]|nr:hypothetical protein [Kaistella sp.]